MSRSLRRFGRVVALLGGLGALAAVPAHAQVNDYLTWGTVGSTGVVDDADTAEVALNERTVSFKRNATVPATAIVRYNVPAGAMGQWGANGSSPRFFSMRYLDNGAAATVNIRLKTTTFSSEAVTTAWFWSSDEAASAPSNSYRTEVQCTYGLLTDFKPTNSYWFEVELIKRDATGSVGFAEILAERDPSGFCGF